MCIPQLMHRAGIAERDIYGRSGRDLSPAKNMDDQCDDREQKKQVNQSTPPREISQSYQPTKLAKLVLSREANQTHSSSLD